MKLFVAVFLVCCPLQNETIRQKNSLTSSSFPYLLYPYVQYAMKGFNSHSLYIGGYIIINTLQNPANYYS